VLFLLVVLCRFGYGRGRSRCSTFFHVALYPRRIIKISTLVTFPQFGVFGTRRSTFFHVTNFPSRKIFVTTLRTSPIDILLVLRLRSLFLYRQRRRGRIRVRIRIRIPWKSRYTGNAIRVSVRRRIRCRGRCAKFLGRLVCRKTVVGIAKSSFFIVGVYCQRITGIVVSVC